MGHYKEAVEAYEKGIVLEPNNDNIKNSLEIAQKKLQESKPKPQTSTPQMPNVPNMPNLANMFGGNPNLANLMNQFGGSGSGGMPDLNTILQNPTFQSFANQMMSNPTFMNMAQNLMANPETAANMMNMVGQMGNQQNQSSTTSSTTTSNTSDTTTNPPTSSNGKIYIYLFTYLQGDDCDTLN